MDTVATYPLHLQDGDLLLVNGEVLAVEALRDSIVNSRTGMPDIAIDFYRADWSLIVPRHQTVEKVIR